MENYESLHPFAIPTIAIRGTTNSRWKAMVHSIPTIRKKSGHYREEQIEPDRSKWWANGNIICNELTKEEDKANMQHWGDHFLAPLRDMLAEACNDSAIARL